MELIKGLVFSGNLIVWVILVVLFLVFVKFLKSVGKSFLILLGVVVGIFVVAKFFPGIAEPISDFIRGGWMGDQRSNRPW